MGKKEIDPRLNMNDNAVIKGLFACLAWLCLAHREEFGIMCGVVGNLRHSARQQELKGGERRALHMHNLIYINIYVQAKKKIFYDHLAVHTRKKVVQQQKLHLITLPC